MARRAAGLNGEPKVAFLVEGDHDKAFVQALAPRVLGRERRLHVVRMGGKAAFSWSFSTVADLVERGYRRVIILVDADTDVPSEIEQVRRNLQATLDRYGLATSARVLLAVPMLDAWPLATFVDDPERVPDPKRELERHLGKPPDYGELGATLDLERARERSPSFDAFVRELEAAPEQHRAAAIRRAGSSRSR